MGGGKTIQEIGAGRGEKHGGLLDVPEWAPVSSQQALPGKDGIKERLCVIRDDVASP